MEKKFTIILLHYNQMNFIYDAIDSILSQTYNNIELIISDDASQCFEKQDIIKYIDKRVDLKFVINDINKGTVETINNCIKISSGDYIYIIAADDRIHDKNVIKNFLDAFENNKDYNIISGQCLMCEKDINKSFGTYVDSYLANNLNSASSFKQFKVLLNRCVYASGATVYKRGVFDKYGLFDEKYILVEDLTYWINITRKGEKIYYVDLVALDHRDGGVSSDDSLKYTFTNTKLSYYFDIILLYEEDVFPYMKKFTNIEKEQTIYRYTDILKHVNRFVLGFYDKKYELVTDLYKNYHSLFLYKIFRKVFNKSKLILKKIFLFPKRIIIRIIKRIINKSTLILFMFLTIWVLFNGIVIIKFSIKENYLLLFICIINYLLAKFFTWSIKIIKNVFMRWTK